MLISRKLSVLALTAVLLAGCKDKNPPSPSLSEVLPNLPLPPRGTVLSHSGGPDALQITFRSSMPADSLARYYRAILTSGVWSLVNDNRAADGTISLYAERTGPPLWVTISKDPNSAGSLLTLGGAVTKSDSTKGGSLKRPTT